MFKNKETALPKARNITRSPTNNKSRDAASKLDSPAIANEKKLAAKGKSRWESEGGKV